jgi:hypothetical protein
MQRQEQDGFAARQPALECRHDASLEALRVHFDEGGAAQNGMRPARGCTALSQLTGLDSASYCLSGLGRGWGKGLPLQVIDGNGSHVHACLPLR